MSKNTNKNTNKNTTTTAPATSNSLARLAELKAKREQLAKEIALLDAESTKEKEAIKQELADKIGSLPNMFGVETLGDVLSLIREYRNDLSNGIGGGRSIVSKEVKDKIVNLIRAAKAPGASPEEVNKGQLSQIVKDYGYSYQNIRNWAIAAKVIVPQKRDIVTA